MKPQDNVKPAGAGPHPDAAATDALAREIVAHLQQGAASVRPQVARRLRDIRVRALRTRTD